MTKWFVIAFLLVVILWTYAISIHIGKELYHIFIEDGKKRAVCIDCESLLIIEGKPTQEQLSTYKTIKVMEVE
jgi:hypothetical protein